MKKTRMPQRLLSLVLVLMMLISVLPVSAMAAELTPSDPKTGLTATDVTNELTDSDRLAIFEENMDSGKVSKSEIPADDEMVRVIVQLDADSLLDVRNRTNASMSMLDFQQTDAAKAQLKDIANLQLSVMNTMESKGIPSSFTFSYTSVVSGFAAQVPYGKIHDIKNIDGVEDVVLCQTYYTDSMGSATLGQALTAAEVAAYSNNTQYQGEGMLIGILDTGLDVNHEAFANAPAVQKLQKSSLSKLLYQITGAEYEALMAASYDDLRHQEVLPAALEDISQVDVTLEGEPYTLTAADGADGPAFAYQGETLESTDFQSALQALTAVSFTDEAPTGKEEIALTLHLEREGSPTVQIALYRFDGENCLATLDGEPLCLVERSAAVSLIEAVHAIVLN